jgi:HAE1 family hydrophobic/amphiphilic exporter-1
MITQKMPPGTSLAETDAAARKIEAVLSADPAVQTYSTSIGGSTSVFMGSQADTNQALYTVPLKTGYSAKDVVDRVRQQIGSLGTAVGTVEVSVGNSTSGVVVYVEGTDADKLKTANDQVVAMMKTVPDLVNVTSDLSEAREQVAVDVDNKAAAELGMNQATIGQAVSRAVRGQLIGQMASGDDTLKVYLRVDKPVKSLAELRKIELPVTQLMNGNAKTDAAQAVQDKSKALQNEGKAAATDAYNAQVKALKKAKKDAQKAASQLESQLNQAKSALSALLAMCANNSSAPGCQTMSADALALNNTIGALTTQLAQLKSTPASIDKQLSALVTSRQKTLESQAQSEAIAQESKDAADATADAVRLDAVATVKIVQAPAMITRVEGSRAATISASSESTNLGATTAQIQAGLSSLNLPDGITYRIGGVSQQQADSFSQLGLAMLVAIAVVYLIMVATFGSLLQPLILLVSIPFAATGALAFSLATDTALGLPSMVGLLMLIGIVVTNAIVLIDLINQKRKLGLGVAESIQAGARLRVRPIIMTALATVFALIPMALGLTGGGVFISKPLAIVVIGGLMSSTLLTLILVPVLYEIIELGAEKRAARKQTRLAAKTA